MPAFQDLTNQRFGRWIVLSRAENKRYPGGACHPRWHCQCDCGTEKVVIARALKDGSSKSCGCLNAEVRKALCVKRNTIHGHAASGKSATYTTWTGIISRCHNEKTQGYKKYGSRGIRVCDRWRTSFENFLADMGEKPHPKASIERINPFKGYEPGNCSWIHIGQQPFNKTNMRIDSFKSLRHVVTQFCDAHGIPVDEFAKTLT